MVHEADFSVSDGKVSQGTRLLTTFLLTTLPCCFSPIYRRVANTLHALCKQKRPGYLPVKRNLAAECSLYSSPMIGCL
jgi:hypothetical protein